MLGGPEEWLPQHLVADLFHVNAKTLKRWQTALGFPRSFKVGGMTFYRAVEIKLWQEQREKESRKSVDNDGQRGNAT